MKNKSPACCQTHNKNPGLKKGLLYGLLPHTFCIAFIVCSVLGVVGVTSFFRRWLLMPYFFPLLIIISVILAVVSMILYLHQNSCLSLAGIKKKARYLSILTISIIGVNLFFFLVAFPLATNLSSKSRNNSSAFNQSSLSKLTLSVEIPCSGHAPLVVEELQKISGVAEVAFRLPNLFDIKYSNNTSAEEVLGAEIFKNFKATKI